MKNTTLSSTSSKLFDEIAIVLKGQFNKHPLAEVIQDNGNQVRFTTPWFGISVLFRERVLFLF